MSLAGLEANPPLFISESFSQIIFDGRFLRQGASFSDESGFIGKEPGLTQNFTK
jgi:hypothetical protein